MSQIIQLLYWLSLSTWFGGVLFIAIAAPIIFRTVRQSNPVLPNVLSVNLEGQHGTLLAGTIVGNLLAMLSWIQILCAAGLFIALIAQWFMLSSTGPRNLIFLIVRSTLWLGAITLVLYDRWHIEPRIWTYRQEYIDHADEPEIANPAKDHFDRYHRESVTILSLVLAMLLAMILFSSTFAESHTYVFP